MLKKTATTKLINKKEEELQLQNDINNYLRCQRCNHFWKYKGHNNYVAACPHCKTTIQVRKRKG
jgi:Zn finger protein HypA/HybF involved in hydrogenase expression